MTVGLAHALNSRSRIRCCLAVISVRNVHVHVGHLNRPKLACALASPNVFTHLDAKGNGGVHVRFCSTFWDALISCGWEIIWNIWTLSGGLPRKSQGQMDRSWVVLTIAAEFSRNFINCIARMRRIACSGSVARRVSIRLETPARVGVRVAQVQGGEK